jgi:hypothetical protein
MIGINGTPCSGLTKAAMIAKLAASGLSVRLLLLTVEPPPLPPASSSRPAEDELPFYSPLSTTLTALPHAQISDAGTDSDSASDSDSDSGSDVGATAGPHTVLGPASMA